MHPISIIIVSLIVLLFLAMAVVQLPIFLFRPFDYRKVAYRFGLLLIVAMILVPLGPALDEGDLSPLRLQSVLEVLGMMIIAALLGALGGYFNYWFLRSLSEAYAKREEALAERKREKSRTRDGEGPVLDSERG